MCPSAICGITVVLLLFLVVFFHPVFLRGHVISANDIAYRIPPFDQLAPAGFLRPRNYLLEDQVTQFYPYRTTFFRNLKLGSWQLWNPYLLCGNSFAANIQSQSFYPPNFLALLFPVPVAETIVDFLDLLIAGLGAALLLRRFRAGTAASLCSAVSFMLCSYNIVWLNHPHGTVAVYTPWLLWSVDRLLREDRIVGREVALAAAICALTITGGHPGTMLNVFFLAGCYAAFVIAGRMVRRDGAALLSGRALLCVGGLTLGLALTAVELLPFAEMLRESLTYVQRAGMAAGTPPLVPRAFLVALLPKAMGSPMTLNDANVYNFNENAMFVGVTPLVLILAILPWAVRRREFTFFLGIAIAIGIGLAGVQPFYGVLRNLPGLRDSVFQRMSLLSQFSLALGGALALDTLLLSLERPTRAMKWWCGIVLAAIVLVALAFQIRNPTVPGVRTLTAACLGASAAVAAAFFFRSTRRFVPGFLVLLLFAELFVSHRAINPTLPLGQALLPEPPLSTRLKEEAGGRWFRITAVDGTLGPNLPGLFGLRDLRGYDLPLPQRYTDFLRTAFYAGRWDYGMSYWNSGGQLLAEENQPLLDLLGVRYVLKNGAVLATRTEARGHAFLAASLARAKADLQMNLELMRDNVMVAESDSVLELHEAGEGSVETLRETVNGASFRVHNVRPTVLIFNEMPLRGWRVRVDGRSSAVFPVNIVQTGVRLDAGEHVVAFTYRPAGFVVGAWISLAALSMTVGLWVSKARKT